MLPVRKGSERLAKKNYLKIGQYTVLEIALLKALKCKAFDRVIINTDDPELEEVASKYGVNFYLRSKYLASSQATSDQVVLDFINHHEGDQFYWLNTVSPLQTISDIKNFVNISEENNWESGVTFNKSQVHLVYDNAPLNFQWENGFARTQDLKPVKCFNYAMMGWSRKTIARLFDGKLFDEDTTLVESSKWSGYLLKNKDDLELITMLAKVAPDQGINL